MRLSLSFLIVLALMIAPLAACEIHAEAGHHANPPPPPPPPPPAAVGAPAPTTTATVRTSHLHLTVSDAGT